MTFVKDRPKYNLECRDAVHGFVYLNRQEWAIVDCPTFQRLRDIRQLAMAHLVYPGATHTRFEHSLGCVHLSDLIYTAIRRQIVEEKCPNFALAFRADEDQVKRGCQVLRLASLLHDIGHSPFSHTGETLMPVKQDAPVKQGEKAKRVRHEEMSARLIRNTEIANAIANEYGTEWIEEVIAVAVGPEYAKLPPGTNHAWIRFLNDILTGELGSDRMDYLLRDAVHSGQSAGIFDYRKMIDSMIIVRPPEETEDDYRLGLNSAGWLVAEQMVVARYLMYVSLYFHKTKRIYEIHLERFLAKWLEQQFGKPELPTDKVEEYAMLTDSTVWAVIYNAASMKNTELQHLARPFVDRTHFRLAHELLLVDNAAKPTQSKSSQPDVRTWDTPRAWDKKRFDNLHNAVYDHVREKLGKSSGVENCVAVDSPSHDAHKFFGDNKIWVWLDEQTRHLDELSEIVSGMPKKIWRGRIYASREYRDKVSEFCKEWLSNNPPTGDSTDGVRD